jgi:hypothetical protein
METLDKMRTEDILYRKLLRTPKTHHRYLEYKQDVRTQKNIVRKAIFVDKNNYYTSKFEQHETDILSTWKTINEVTGRKKSYANLPKFFNKKIIHDDATHELKKITGDKDIAEELNNFYANIGIDLSNAINYNGTKNIDSFLQNKTEQRFKFHPVSDEDVKRFIGKIKPKSSSGHDNITSKLLLQMSPTIHPILKVIINQSLATGIVPKNMKIAKVIPVYKGKNSDIHNFGNYRPISLLPAFSKVLEKVVHSQLYTYLNVNRLLNDNQYGFRPFHSTEYAAIHLVDRLNESLRNKNIPFAVFIDLSKAFDTLDHDILTKKLEYYGIAGTEITWFKNYLGDRKQYVKYNNVTSPFAKIKTGVPQGSVLGPLLFLIYINDISEATKALDDVLFADDTSLYA